MRKFIQFPYIWKNAASLGISGKMEEMTSSIFILYTIFYPYLYSILFRFYSIDTELLLLYDDGIIHLKENISGKRREKLPGRKRNVKQRIFFFWCKFIVTSGQHDRKSDASPVFFYFICPCSVTIDVSQWQATHLCHRPNAACARRMCLSGDTPKTPVNGMRRGD